MLRTVKQSAPFLERNYAQDLTLGQPAHYTGRSLSAFKRDFAAAFDGETPSRRMVKRRLDAAYDLLKRGESTPAEIYLKVGFKNLSHFSTTFKRRFGIVPSALRRDA